MRVRLTVKVFLLLGMLACAGCKNTSLRISSAGSGNQPSGTAGSQAPSGTSSTPDTSDTSGRGTQTVPPPPPSNPPGPNTGGVVLPLPPLSPSLTVTTDNEAGYVSNEAMRRVRVRAESMGADLCQIIPAIPLLSTGVDGRGALITTWRTPPINATSTFEVVCPISGGLSLRSSVAATVPFPLVTSDLAAHFDAAYSDGGAAPSTLGCTDRNWTDMSTIPVANVLSSGFFSCGVSSGWNGQGLPTEPHRLTFDGIDDSSHLPASISVGNALNIYTGSLFTWIRPTGPIQGGYAGIVSKRLAFGMSLKDGVFGIYDWGGGGTFRSSGITLTDGAWHYVGFTFRQSEPSDPNWTTLYVDGVQAGPATRMKIHSYYNRITIGSGSDEDNDSVTRYPFRGDIAHVTIYRRVLSAAEVQQNCRALSPRFAGAVCH